MWELICHHTYKWEGAPIDLSYYDNPAEARSTAYLKNGVSADSGALRFNGSATLRMPPGPAWSPLVGLRADVTLRLNGPSSKAQTIIEGDRSFGLYVHDQILFAFFRGKSPYPGIDTDGLNTYKDGLNFPGYRLPYGQWTDIVFVHDGLDRMQLAVNGDPVTFIRSTLSEIPPVGSKGVYVGNGGIGDTPLVGEIDDVKIWRTDPRAMWKEFLLRPLDREAARCWERLLRSLRDAFRRHPDCAGLLVKGLEEASKRSMRQIHNKGPESRQRFRRARADFQNLWAQGRLDDPEMREVLADWFTWMRLIGVPPGNDPDLQSLLASDCFARIANEIPNPDCDKDFTALLRAVMDACGLGSHLSGGTTEVGNGDRRS